MNDQDLMCAVIEQLLDAETLAQFAATIDRDPESAAADLSRSTPSPVVTAEYTVSATPFGVLASNANGRTSGMSWDRISDALAGAGLEARMSEIEQLESAPDSLAHQIRADLARRATLAARLADRPLQHLDIGPHKVSVDFHAETATVQINDTASLSVTPWENVATANVGIHDRDGNEAQRLRTQFVPPGFARPGRAKDVTERVSLERLDDPSTATNLNHPTLGGDGGKFAVQVDGYDVAIVDVGETRMRTTVYDQDPRNAFLAHESISDVPGTEGPSRAPTAAQRLAKLCERRAGGKQNGLER